MSKSDGGQIKDLFKAVQKLLLSRIHSSHKLWNFQGQVPDINQDFFYPKLSPDGVERNPRESSHNLWEGKLLMNSMSRSRPTPELRQRAYLPSSRSGHCVELDSRLRISGFQLTYSMCMYQKKNQREWKSILSYSTWFRWPIVIRGVERRWFSSFWWWWWCSS